MPQVTDVAETRLATSGMLTSRSCAIESRNGARVVPLEVAAKEPRQAAPIKAQGSAREAAEEIMSRERATLSAEVSAGNRGRIAGFAMRPGSRLLYAGRSWVRCRRA